MRSAFDVASVRAAESAVMQVVDPLDLMRTAARGLYGVVRDLLIDRSGAVTGRRVVLLVGSGNNGGDALFAGSFLAGRGAAVQAVALADRIHEAGARALVTQGGRMLAPGPAAHHALAAADVVIDGIVGIGAQGPLRETAAGLLDHIAPDAAVVSVDLPSGIDPDSGAVADPARAVRADVTVTFGCLKPGLVLPPGREHSGIVTVIDIGLGPELSGKAPAVSLLDHADVGGYFAAEGDNDYKYSHGVPGICAGSARYPGAAHMVVGAARHAGVGMVRYWDDGSAVGGTVVERYPDVVTTQGDPAGDRKATGWVVGPGFGTGAPRADVVRSLLGTALPVVVDADALTLVAADDSIRSLIGARTGPTVLTPHEAEFRRLGFDLDGDRVAAASSAAAALGCILLLKGAGTVIAAPDGRTMVDAMGTAALATAGTGDALSGLIGAVLSRRPPDPLTAVAAAVYVHGLAGRLAAADSRPITAWDLVTAVPRAVATVRR